MFVSFDRLRGRCCGLARAGAVFGALGACLVVRAADVTVSTNWEVAVGSTYTVANSGGDRFILSAYLSGAGTVVVDTPGGLRLDRPNYNFAGDFIVQRGRLDARATSAFGCGGTVRLKPANPSQLPTLNVGTYSSSASEAVYTVAFTNTFVQTIDVPDTEPETPVPSSTTPTFALLASGASQHTYAHLVGETRFSSAGVVKVGESSAAGRNFRLFFDGPVTLPEDQTLHVLTWGDCYFNDKLTARRLFLGREKSQRYTVHLDTPQHTLKQVELYAGCLEVGTNCAAVLPQLHWPQAWAAGGEVTLLGSDYATPGLSFTSQLDPLKRFFAPASDSVDPATQGPSISSAAPATLTLTGGKYTPEGYSVEFLTNYVACVRLGGQVSLRVDAWTNEFTQTLRLMTSTTTGALDVNKGCLRIESPASFVNLSSIRIGAEGVLESVLTNSPATFEGVENVSVRAPAGGYVTGMYQSVTNLDVAGRFLMTDLEEADPLPSLRVLALTRGARVELPSDCTLRLTRFIYDGVDQPAGVYAPSEFARGGRIVVEPSAPGGEIRWTGTNANDSVQYGYNWEGYGPASPALNAGTQQAYFAVSGTNVVFDTPALFYGLTLKAPTGVKTGVTLRRERGVGGRAAVLAMMAGGLAVKDGTSTSASARRTHRLELPVRAYQTQTWNIDRASTVWLAEGYSDGGVRGVEIEKTGLGTLVLDGTNVISAGSALTVPSASANQGYLGITGAVHVAGVFAVNKGAMTVNGRIAGAGGAVGRGEAVPDAEGVLTFRGSATAVASRFTLNGTVLDLPVWLSPATSLGTLFYLGAKTESHVRGPLFVQNSTKGATISLYTQGGTIFFENRVVATNCNWKTSGAGRAVFANTRAAETGGNQFYMYSATAGVTEFNTPGNTFRDGDYGGVTFDGASTVLFNTGLVMTNGTLRFNSLNERSVYKSFCHLGATSQRVDRLVAVRAATGTARTNFATLAGDGAWLEIAGDRLASTNGLVVSNCVNIAKTGSADLVYYDHALTHDGELNILNGRVVFETNATWQTAKRIRVTGPGRLRLNASERFAPQVSVRLDNLYDDPVYADDPPVLRAEWGLELPAGVTQRVAAVALDGVLARSGAWGNTNFNRAVTCHDDRIQGAGVLLVAPRSLVLRFR